jgi:hypothetical protein
MTAKRASLLFAGLLAAVAACGGGDKKDSKIPSGGEGGEAADQAARQPVLPAIPDSPAAMPDAVLATFSIGSPRAQLAELSAYADAINPGLGAMVGANVLPALAGVAGAPGLDGYDLDKPLHVVVLDPKQGGGEVMLVVAVADADRLAGSVGGSALLQMHQGFAAIGKTQALVAASPYALSNLARATVPAHPHLTVHMNRIMDAYGADLEKRMRDNFGASQPPGQVMLAQQMVSVLRGVDRIEAGLQASAQDATATVSVFPTAGSLLAGWASAQQPADFTAAQRLPKGPWMMLAAGRFNWTGLTGFLAEVAAAQGTSGLAEYLELVGEEIALAAFVKRDEELRVSALASIKAGAGKKMAALLTQYVKGMAKAPKKMDSMQVTGKAGAFKTGGASMHMLTVQPGPDADADSKREFAKTYGKGGLKAYFGIAGDWLVLAMDKDKTAKGLAGRGVSGAKQKAVKKSQLGGVFEAAVAASKDHKESGIMVFDLAAMSPDPVAAKGAEVTVGLGFEGSILRSRISIPPATGRFVMQQQMGAIGGSSGP